MRKKRAFDGKEVGMTERKTKIAIICNSGFEFYCFRREIAEELIKEGFDVLVCCVYGKKIELVRDLGFTFVEAKMDRRGKSVVKDLKLFFQYRSILKKYSPDVVLTFTSKPNVYASYAARLLKIPYINNVTGLGSAINNKKALKKLVFFLLKTAFRKSSCVMFQNSENLRIAQENKLLKGRSVLLPGSGVNCERFSVLSYPDGGDGKRGAPVVFNYVGRVLKEKGVEIFIAAAKVIVKEYPNVVFNVLGPIEATEDHYVKDLENLQNKGVLNYYEEQDDIRPFVERSHATIHPSMYGEGMSNALLESAAMGRALITTDNPGCRETVIDGVSGYIFKVGDADGLIETIKRFLSLDNEDRKKMGEAGRRHVEENFNRDIVVKTYLEEITNILQKAE